MYVYVLQFNAPICSFVCPVIRGTFSVLFLMRILKTLLYTYVSMYVYVCMYKYKYVYVVYASVRI